MAKFDLIREKYLKLDVREDNIDFAIGAVLDGTKREHIIESLTADYRGMIEAQSTQLLQDLFAANGGEFKKENRGGYLNGALLLLVGLTGTGFFIAMLLTGEAKVKFIVLSLSAAVFGLPTGAMAIIKSVKGKYRDNDDALSEL
jgi:hypothetical protein